MQIKLSVSTAVEGFYYVFGSVKRVQSSGLQSDLVALIFVNR